MRAGLSVVRGNPLDPRVRTLIAELDAFSSSLYSAESNHFDSAETLAAANVCFLVALLDGEPVGCGAVKHCQTEPRPPGIGCHSRSS
jgi:hypothetical protein